MRLKLIAKCKDKDGLIRSPDVKVVNAETGEMLHGIQEVTFHCKAMDLATVTMKVMNVETELEFDVCGDHLETLEKYEYEARIRSSPTEE